MLGLQETKSAGTPPSKTYSCVACSATFNGLSSLLVHQASHASEISDQKAAMLPTCSHCGGLFASPELLQKHHCMVLPPPFTQDVYVCDCGEKFHELDAIQEHKKLHEIKTHVRPQSEETSNEPPEIKTHVKTQSEETSNEPPEIKTHVKTQLEETSNEPSEIKTHVKTQSEETSNEPPEIKTHVKTQLEETSNEPSEIKTHVKTQSEETSNEPSEIKTHVKPQSEETSNEPSEIKTHVKTQLEETSIEPPEIKTHVKTQSEETSNEPHEIKTHVKTQLEETSNEPSEIKTHVKTQLEETSNEPSEIKTHVKTQSEETSNEPSEIKTHVKTQSEETSNEPSEIKTHVKTQSEETSIEPPEIKRHVKTQSEETSNEPSEIKTHVKTQLEETSNEPSEINEECEINENSELTVPSELAQMDCHSSPVEVPSDENSPSLCTDESLHQNTQTASEECLSTSDSHSVQNTISEVHHDEGSEPSDLTSLLVLTEAQDQSLEYKVENVTSENTCAADNEETQEESQESSDKKSLLKMLASAYMNCRQPAQQQLEQSKRTLPPRKVSPRAPVQAPAIMSASSSGYFINQLIHKVTKYGPDRMGFRQSSNTLNLKPVKKKKKKRIVSTTKSLYPVVALETCQKLVRDNIEGRHQCGLCRRVFQDVDSLIMHHALHKKERVKFCRRCRQYVITVISVPHNHICTSSVGFSRHFTLLTSNSPTSQHSRKLFHCTKCNRSYTRRHRLNKHNCQWLVSLKRSAAGAQTDDKVSNFGEDFNAEKQLMSVQQDSSCPVNVSVNTGVLKLVKTEEHNTDSLLEEKYQIGLSPNSGVHIGSAKSFPPFRPNVSKFRSVQSQERVNSVAPTAAQDEMRPGSDTEAGESLGESQWTVPLDDAEIDVMDVDEEKHVDLIEAPKDSSDEMVVLEPTVKYPTSSILSCKDFQVHISAGGAKRFSCNRCQRSYSRRFTVKQHLKICGARKLMEQNSFGKKKFPCPCCGTSFTRKDNMNMHRKRCQAMRSAGTLEAIKLSEKKNQASQENIFVLPPVSKNQVRQESSNNNSGSGNWGIMSLPSVLPRKVTCECGVAFTCPRLLFEHLQLHAMESYICSHCGENLQSWAEFEAHQKFHTQTSVQKSEQKVSQPQQPQLQQVPRFQSAVQNQNNQSRLNHRPLTEPCVCHRCKKVFRRRKSLLRHLRLSCRGDIAGQNKLSCSRCGMTFQSPLAHKVHVQGNTCTPSFKPIRCPVCVRWFSCVDGLKRHLVSHSQQKVLTCQICEHKCSSHEDLEEHKRQVHGTKEATESPTIQSAHVSQSNPSDAFQCQICHRSYSKLQSLKDHLRKVHRPQGLKPGEPKAGGLQSLVGTVQQGQSKQFQCHICSRTYPDIKSLKNHKRRVHRILGSGIQPSKGTLQQSHSNPFQCHICSRSYPDLRSLRNHRRRVHRILGGLEMFKGIVHQSQGTPYRCQICQRSYPDVRSLKNHRRRVHHILGDVPESAKVVATDVEESDVKSEPVDVTLSPSTAPETAVQ